MSKAYFIKGYLLNSCRLHVAASVWLTVGSADLFNYIMELSLRLSLLSYFNFMLSSPLRRSPALEILCKTYLNDCKWRCIIFDCLHILIDSQFLNLDGIMCHFTTDETRLGNVIKCFKTCNLKHKFCQILSVLFSWLLCCSIWGN